MLQKYRFLKDNSGNDVLPRDSDPALYSHLGEPLPQTCIDYPEMDCKHLGIYGDERQSHLADPTAVIVDSGGKFKNVKTGSQSPKSAQSAAQ